MMKIINRSFRLFCFELVQIEKNFDPLMPLRKIFLFRPWWIQRIFIKEILRVHYSNVSIDGKNPFNEEKNIFIDDIFRHRTEKFAEISLK